MATVVVVVAVAVVLKKHRIWWSLCLMLHPPIVFAPRLLVMDVEYFEVVVGLW
jgi:hypothetical protein